MGISTETINEAGNIDLHRGTENWYAIQTRPRHEKKVSAELLYREIVAYLPLAEEIHRWSDRRKRVEVPLFPNYVFVRMAFSPQTRVAVLRVDGVLSFVGAHNLGTPIPDSQIEDIRALLANHIPLQAHPFLTVGQRVRIHGGALDGLEGIFTGQNGNRRLVISIESIQRSIAVSVEGYEIEALPLPVGKI